MYADAVYNTSSCAECYATKIPPSTVQAQCLRSKLLAQHIRHLVLQLHDDIRIHAQAHARIAQADLLIARHPRRAQTRVHGLAVVERRANQLLLCDERGDVKVRVGVRVAARAVDFGAERLERPAELDFNEQDAELEDARVAVAGVGAGRGVGGGGGAVLERGREEGACNVELVVGRVEEGD